MNKSHYSQLHTVASYYDSLVKKYGHDPRACDYGRPESQLIKFNILYQGILTDGKTILDVGCGFADFYTFLEARTNSVKYTGIDISDQMINHARQIHPNLDIRKLNILKDDPGRFDYIVANGIFYLLGRNAWTMMKQLVSRMYDLSEEGIAFNSLSIFSPEKETGEFYADPGKVMNYCLSSSKKVVLRHDYHERDFSVFMYK